MCGRFYDVFDLDDITTRFRVERPPALAFPPRYNLAPTQMAPVVRVQDDERELVLLRWGLIPPWAADPKIGARMNNARAETVAEKPSFRKAYAERRCIVPVSGFYEWHRAGTVKAPYAISATSGDPLPFAGLWERWGDLETFTIVTTAATPAMARIHDRMPLILAREQIDRWLDPDDPDPADILASVPSEELQFVAVSPHVNNARNDDPHCLEPVA